MASRLAGRPDREPPPAGLQLAAPVEVPGGEPRRQQRLLGPLPLIQVPTLVLHHQDFQLVPLAHGRYLVGACPQVMLAEAPVVAPARSEARKAATLPTSASEVSRFSMVLPSSQAISSARVMPSVDPVP
jgi:pimeloyl-ACP methyl ester carboxylesterase